jgi:hypothetical protein
MYLVLNSVFVIVFCAVHLYDAEGTEM